MSEWKPGIQITMAPRRFGWTEFLLGAALAALGTIILLAEAQSGVMRDIASRGVLVIEDKAYSVQPLPPPPQPSREG